VDIKQLKASEMGRKKNDCVLTMLFRECDRLVRQATYLDVFTLKPFDHALGVLFVKNENDFRPFRHDNQTVDTKTKKHESATNFK
jgi:hypothetical protein